MRTNFSHFYPKLVWIAEIILSLPVSKCMAGKRSQCCEEDKEQTLEQYEQSDVGGTATDLNNNY